ncbi:MAG: WbqC family protein, partial [Deltaproteobacteria bacterium]|nr:WbqC family protein [Deltaproteobacteria bacterium]
LESLKTAYKHAPYLEEHLDFLEDLFTPKWERLVDLNLAVIRHLLSAFQLDVKVVLQSELGIKAKGTQLLVELCRALGAETYVILDQVKKHLDLPLFEQNGIKLRPLKYVPPVYPQLWGDFLANLSSLDLILNCGPKARNFLLHRQPGGR